MTPLRYYYIWKYSKLLEMFFFSNYTENYYFGFSARLKKKYFTE